MLQTVKQTREEMIKMYMKSSKKELASMLAARDELEQSKEHLPTEAYSILKTADSEYAFDPKDILGHEPLTAEQMKALGEMYLQHDWEALRHQAAIAAMQAIITASDESVLKHKGEVAWDAVRFADALIEQMKK